MNTVGRLENHASDHFTSPSGQNVQSIESPWSTEALPISALRGRWWAFLSSCSANSNFLVQLLSMTSVWTFIFPWSKPGLLNKQNVSSFGGHKINMPNLMLTYQFWLLYLSRSQFLLRDGIYKWTVVRPYVKIEFWSTICSIGNQPIAYSTQPGSQTIAPVAIGPLMVMIWLVTDRFPIFCSHSQLSMNQESQICTPNQSHRMSCF